MPVNVFIRQPFTQSGNGEQHIVQSVMDVLKAVQGQFKLNFLTPPEAESATTFKPAFEAKTGRPFTPKNFRQYRLSLLDQADVFINIRTGLSESGSFEIAYNIFKGRKAPILFLVWDEAEIKTTLLRELDDVCDVTYVTFKDPAEVKEKLVNFLQTRVAALC